MPLGIIQASFCTGKQRHLLEKLLNPQLGESSLVMFLPYLENSLSLFLFLCYFSNLSKLTPANKRLERSAAFAHFPSILEK